jgi:hypothetical protein
MYIKGFAFRVDANKMLMKAPSSHLALKTLPGKSAVTFLFMREREREPPEKLLENKTLCGHPSVGLK